MVPSAELDAAVGIDAESAGERVSEVGPPPFPPPDSAASMADDTGPSTCVSMVEVCDGADNDCNGLVDETVTTSCWRDADGDGFAAAGAELTRICDSCGLGATGRDPAAPNANDCDDEDATRAPGVTDLCGDDIDNDCDGVPDDERNNACGGPCTAPLAGRPGEPCANGLFGACARTGKYECQADLSVRCSAPKVAGTEEICDGKDNDCDGQLDEGVKNACGTCGPTTTPEACDDKDNNCDGQVDEGVKNACGTCGPTTTPEACDGKDNNCDGQVDEGVKNACGACGPTTTAEVCDAMDNNCNGQVDEGVKNACGGCAALPNAAQLSSACDVGTGRCKVRGAFGCMGPDEVRCTSTVAALLPIPEVCGNFQDEDCDGSADNGCKCYACTGFTGGTTYSWVYDEFLSCVEVADWTLCP